VTAARRPHGRCVFHQLRQIIGAAQQLAFNPILTAAHRALWRPRIPGHTYKMLAAALSRVPTTAFRKPAASSSHSKLNAAAARSSTHQARRNCRRGVDARAAAGAFCAVWCCHAP
jgi:hypothetical protein